MNVKQIELIVANIKMHVATIETALDSKAGDPNNMIDRAGESISSLGDMIRDAVLES